MALKSGKAARRDGGDRPPNAGQRCIHGLARGYISHPVLDIATSNRVSCLVRCRVRYRVRCGGRYSGQSHSPIYGQTKTKYAYR